MESIGVAVSYLVNYDTLLQNATNIIRKCDTYFITKCDKMLLQHALGFLLQNATVLIQIATVITKCVDFITNASFITKCLGTWVYKIGNATN